MIQEAPLDVTRRINGLEKVPRQLLTGIEMSSRDLAALENFAVNYGRWQFARERIPEPQEGRKINPQAAYQVKRNGPVCLYPSSDSITCGMMKKMRKDPQIALGLAALKAPIMAAFDSIRVDCRDPVIRGFMQQALMSEYGGVLRRAVYRALRSLDFGFIAHEKVWDNGVPVEFQVEEENSDGPKTKTFHKATMLREVSDLDPEYTEVFVNGRNGSYMGIRYGSSNDQLLQAEKTWLVTHSMEFKNLLGNSMLNVAHESWYWCKVAYLFTLRYYERKASPPIKARAPAIVTDESGTTKTGVEVFTSMLDSLVSDGICVLPSEQQNENGRYGEYLWDVEYMLDDKRGEMFIRFLEHLQTLKLRALLLPEMVVERGGSPVGSYGMARVHTDTLIDMLTLILEEVLHHVNLYLIPEIVAHNFGSNAPPCSISTLTKIGERRDLLEQLLLEVIKAESTNGSIDTARVIDTISLLRQLNIHTQPRRDAPDYQEQVNQENRVIAVQEKQAEEQIRASKVSTELQKKQTEATVKATKAGVNTKTHTGNPDATPKVLPRPNKTKPKKPKVAPTATKAMDLVDERLTRLEEMVRELHSTLVDSGS